MKPLPPSTVHQRSRPASPRGFTLLEVATVVTLMGLALASALPAVGNLRDRMAVVGARESVVGVFHRARMEAVAHGGASILLRSAPSGVELRSGGALRISLELADEFGVTLSLSGGRAEAELHFDPLGLGRVASQTLAFTRNGAEAGLVVSSFGRVTRR